MSLFQRQKIHLLSLLPARMTMERTIQVLQNYKRDGWALSDTIDEALKHARKEKTKFLLRADVKEKLKEYADLLLGAHSSRKGATNHAAQAGLCSDVLMAGSQTCS